MRYISIGLAVIIIVAGVILWLRLRPHAVPLSRITNYPAQGTAIIAIGDSLVAGYGATAGHDLVSDLSKDIGKPIVNLGVNGDTSTRVLARLGQLDTYHPKVVIVLVGGNDALRAVPHDTTFSNIALIIQNIQKRGAIVLLLGVRGGLPFDDPYAAPFQQLSETYHTAFVPDVLAGVFEDNTKMSDVIHPNDAGYAYIASRVYPVLKPLVQ